MDSFFIKGTNSIVTLVGRDGFLDVGILMNAIKLTMASILKNVVPISTIVSLLILFGENVLGP